MSDQDFARQTQFDYLYEGLKQKYPGLFTIDKQSIFQFMEMPIEAGWTSGGYSAAFNLADTVPAKQGGFYTTGASRVTLAYRSLLESMYKAIGEKNPEYRQLKDRLGTYYKQLEAKVHEAIQMYQGWKANNFNSTLSFSDWLDNDPLAWSKKAEIDNIRKDITRYNEKCAEIEGALGKALQTAQERLTTDCMTLEDGRVVPRTNIGGNLQDDIGRWKGNKNQFDLNVTINKNQKITTPWHETVKTEVKAANCHPPELNTYINIQRLVLDQHYSLNVKAVGLQGYPISRGSWYNDSFVRPSIELPEGATLKKQDFFGQHGSLHLIPTMVLVIYHPVIELTISTKTYKEEIEKNSRLQAIPTPLMLFGLLFDIKASFQKGVLVDQDKTTVTIVPPENQSAQILGVTSVNKSIG
jgi:hypothetical protein